MLLNNRSHINYNPFPDLAYPKQEAEIIKALKEEALKYPASFCRKIKDLNIHQDRRLELAIICFEQNLPSYCFQDLNNFHLTQNQQFKLALHLATQRIKLSQHIVFFNLLNEEQRAQIATIVSRFHPYEVFDHWDKYKITNLQLHKPISDNMCALLQAKDAIVNCWKKFDLKTFSTALYLCFMINQSQPLPNNFKIAIKEMVLRNVKDRNPKTVLAIVHAINSYPSMLTYDLINAIEYQNKFARTYVAIKYDSAKKQNMHMRGSGIDAVLKQQKTSSITKLYPCTYLGKLAQPINAFLNSRSLKKAAIPISFSSDLIGHVCPLYLEKDEGGKIHVFIADSLGEEGNYAHAFAYEILENVHFLLDKHVGTIYLLAPKRQNGFAVCATFTVADLLDCIHYSGFLKKVERAKIEEKTHQGISYASVAPPLGSMMRMTQSLTKIKKYIEEKGTNLIEVAGKLDLEKGPVKLRDYVELYSFTTEIGKDGPKKQNLAAELAMSKMYEMILHNLWHSQREKSHS